LQGPGSRPAERRLKFGALAGAVVEDEGVAVAGEDEGDIQGQRIVERLLKSVRDGVGVVLDLDDRDWDAAVVQDEIGALGLAAGDQLAADDDAALGEVDLAADLGDLVPARPSRSPA
jgi:hypothetical protein